MKKTAEDPRCLEAGTTLGLMDDFRQNNDALEGITKGLEEFLEVRFRILMIFVSGQIQSIRIFHLGCRSPEYTRAHMLHGVSNVPREPGHRNGGEAQHLKGSCSTAAN